MANNLYQEFGNNPFQNNVIMQFAQQVKDFGKNYKMDAKTEVEKMVKMGVLPQNVFNELAQTANEILPFINMMK